ncbi:hypothetical protein KKF61_08305 [Patescibacteria group bacterium]|nr:hypothetical protein [Patescibacteria group bacterium]
MSAALEIVAESIKYYPGLPYRRYNIHLILGWILFYHKDAWSCDVQLYKTNKQVNLVWWRRYNTIYGMAWMATIFGIGIMSPTARKSWNKKGVIND